jgi:hypothetical protein
MQKGIGRLYNRFITAYEERPLLRRAFLTELKSKTVVDEDQYLQLLASLEEVESHTALLMLSHFLVSDFLQLPLRLTYTDYEAPEPSAGMKTAERFAFLLLLACMEPAMERLSRLGMPEDGYRETMLAAVNRQSEKWRRTGSPRVDDFPWDIHFYTGGIFKIGRFLFKFEKFWQPVSVYRNGAETAAFFTDPVNIRRDGQLNGVNGVYDPEAFTAITGHRIHPAGVYLPAKITGDNQNPADDAFDRQPPQTTVNRGMGYDRCIKPDAKKWKRVLKEGDITLGMHIPGGPGYDAAHLRESLRDARAFFARWFPEMKPRAFANESWLNDPHIARLLNGEGNIPNVQKEMYLLPTAEGDEMALRELFPEGLESPPRTRLQKAALDFMRNGGRFTTAAMFILTEDIERIGSGPYAGTDEYEWVWNNWVAV